MAAAANSSDWYLDVSCFGVSGQGCGPPAEGAFGIVDSRKALILATICLLNVGLLSTSMLSYSFYDQYVCSGLSRSVAS